ncbi:conserved hypothetical protein [Mesorhizobium metallidurans STM 2683]|uniref:Uncharacterized protein n=1 Tax=Mesorhizobium metallidurans STM 2683 TaxID=1297569 RepID=M5EUA8_9HYPH|nr:conserved hypothetical protein [Mesorhizobium metallidurans STM 2683]
MAKGEFLAGVGAAPHLPAGILSPYSDGERGAFIDGFANHKRFSKSAETTVSPFLPVTMRREMSGPPSAAAAQLLRRTGRTMRGGAGVDNWSEAIALGGRPDTVLLLKEDNI